MPHTLSSTLPLLVDFGNIAMRGDDLQEIIERAVACVCEGIQVGKAAILSLGPDTKLAPLAWSGWDDRLIGNISIDPAGPMPCAQVYRSERVSCSGFSRDQHGPWPKFLDEGGVAALIGATRIISIPMIRPFS